MAQPLFLSPSPQRTHTRRRGASRQPGKERFCSGITAAKLRARHPVHLRHWLQLGLTQPGRKQQQHPLACHPAGTEAQPGVFFVQADLRSRIRLLGKAPCGKRRDQALTARSASALLRVPLLGHSERTPWPTHSSSTWSTRTASHWTSPLTPDQKSPRPA